MDPTPLVLPHVYESDAELDLVEMPSDGQDQTAGVSQDAIERNTHSAPSSVAENDIEKLPPESRSWVELEKGDVDEAQPVHTHADNALTHQYTHATIPGIVKSASAGSECARPSLVLESGSANAVDHVRAPNIIIFGEAGVGKSSVINLIADQKRAHVSNDALGCTFEYERHFVSLDGIPFALWDTTGLDEGSEGIVPARTAEIKLKVLIEQLAHLGGIHLVIYCIRGTRLTKALKRNYDLFYVSVCQKKVPVALVVTGLEHHEGEMETWWTANEASLQRNGMWFDAHACVTTLNVDDPYVQARRSDSKRRLRSLLAEYAGQRPWKIEESSISWPLLRNILRRVSSKTTRRVIIYDDTTSCRTDTRLIGARQLEYELVYVDKPLSPPLSGKLPGVLVFYTSPLLDTGISGNDLTSLGSFHYTAGRKICPMIVVLRGCKNDQLAQACWEEVAPRYPDILAWPIADEQSELHAMIEKWCIEHVEVRPSGSKLLHKAVVAIMEFFEATSNSAFALLSGSGPPVPDARESAILQ